MAKFELFLPVLQEHEGGYVNDSEDPGGETNHGITIRVARDNGYTGNMIDLTWDQAVKIYKSEYWDKMNLDLMDDQQVAEEIMDMGVNAGVSEGVKVLQRSLNILNRNQTLWPDVKEDGILGSVTLGITNAYVTSDKWALYKTIDGEKYIVYRQIVREKPYKEKYWRSWLRRV